MKHSLKTNEAQNETQKELNKLLQRKIKWDQKKQKMGLMVIN